MGIRENLQGIHGRIEAAARRAGRDPEDVELVGVSKYHDLDRIREAWDAGLRCFGESRIQEAIPKIEAFGEGPSWHLIGHLQRNKANKAVGQFGLIHSVDSARLIEAIEKRAAALDVSQPVLLQVNVSGEASKEGAAPEQLEGLLECLREAPHVTAVGFMTVAPYADDPEDARPHFRRLRELLKAHRDHPCLEPRHLSMGMSDDFEVAIEEGATLIRVGTSIFGPRHYG